ncbi:uncharacterized protein PRCAT00003515001 [Priceomyces carsonii]|uniref:uncharacterized protein n=1 Tax=Priceomyces carsonii TaxID=28549 RepID=UPI002EDB040D|nr:unnamed protein product [Priceomyces carsonii]
MSNIYSELTFKYPTCKEEDEFRQDYNRRMLERLLSTMKINVDPILAGVTEDNRYTCGIVARPSESLTEKVQLIQNIIKSSVKANQALWFLPPELLHLTVLEIALLLPKSSIMKIVEEVLPHIETILRIANDGPVLNEPLICFDSNAIAVSFTSVGKCSSRYRQDVFESVSLYDIKAQPRYLSPTMHITIVRFVKELDEEDIKSLLQKVDELNSSIQNFEWKVSKCELNYGLGWYGQPKKGI